MFNEILEKIFANTYKFSNHDVNKFISLLQIDIKQNEYMDDWEKFNETLLPEKEDFNSNWNLQNTYDLNYTHSKGVCQDFEIKH